MRRNLRTPATPAIADARTFAARVRAALAVIGGALLAVDPDLHPHPVLAGIGLAVMFATGCAIAAGLSDRWLRLEEIVACAAGALIVTSGPAHVSALTLLWLTAAAVGVLARGGRVTEPSRLLVLGILLSPAASHGVSADTTILAACGIAWLIAAGRVATETSLLLRDPLTGVLSRAALDAEVARLLEDCVPGRPVALVMVDLDDFGAINKRSGHQEGDAILMRAAHTMEQRLREDDVFGRLGGDEFVALVAGADAAEVAQRLVDAVGALGVGASAGVAVCPRHGREPDTVQGGRRGAGGRQDTRQTTSRHRHVGPSVSGGPRLRGRTRVGGIR